MNDALVDRIARAVLYEGYVLYPYRPSSVKNRQRWTFGGIYPRAYSDAQGGAEPWAMQAQCLVTGDATTRITLAVRFLHLTERTVERARDDGAFERVPVLEAGGSRYETWQEAVERSVQVEERLLADLFASPKRHPFLSPGSRDIEKVRDGTRLAGRLVRRRWPLNGAIEVAARQTAAGVYQLHVRVCNESALDDGDHQASAQDASTNRDAALLRTLASTHMLLAVRDGAFVSSTDPPAMLKSFSDECQNVGCWPVLVGEPGQTDTLLVSPIILPDYPQVAPESPGDLFDGCEIDEILTLRILTLTDEEKRQAMAADPRAADMLARTQSLAREQLMNLHGVIRGMSPAPITTTTIEMPEHDHA